MNALGLTLLSATLAVVLSLVPALWLGHVMARRDFFGKSVVEGLLTLPTALPPPALGFALLLLLSSDGPVAKVWPAVHEHLLFSFYACVLAAAVHAMPLMTRTARVAFEGVPARMENMGRVMGLSRREVWRHLTLPLAGKGLLGAMLMGFCRAMGEFGTTIVIAGNMPGRTQTLPLAIYAGIYAGSPRETLWLVGLAAAVAFVAAFFAERLLRSRP